jgi:hypothetical protein
MCLGLGLTDKSMEKREADAKAAAAAARGGKDA